MKKLIVSMLLPLLLAGEPMLAVQPVHTSIECVPLAVYRYRTDGLPGREIRLTSKDNPFKGKVYVEVEADGRKETTGFPARKDGYTELSILLPPELAVKEACEVTVTIRSKGGSSVQKLTVPPMRHWTIYLYNHAHVDIGYTNTHKNVELLHINNIREGIKLGEETQTYPEGARYRWNPEITWPVERLWNNHPEERPKMLKAIKDGSLCLDASYLNLNTSTCSDEELFHVFSFSRKLQKLTSKQMDVLQQMDIPGMSWGLVPVMAQQGVRYIMSWPNGSDRIGFARQADGKPCWWIGPDGKSKVLYFQPGNYANSGSMTKGGETGRPWFGQRDPEKVPLVIRTGNANVDFSAQVTDKEKAGDYPYDFLVLSWTLWDNCPLDADIPAAVKAWNETHAYPQIRIAGGHEIMNMIETKYGNSLPEVRGDFTEYWTDGLGTAAGLTAKNRNAKEKLVQAETLWTMLRPGRPAPRREFDEAWRYILMGSEHTWCFENPTEPFFQDAIWKVKQGYFREAADRSQVLLDDALAPATDRSQGGLGPAEGPAKGGIAVFNTHSWQHGGLVTLSPAESCLGDRVIDESGHDVPSQRLSSGELVFRVQQVPALGSRHFRVTEGKSTVIEGCHLEGTTLENNALRLVVDPATGNISSLVLKATGYDYADTAINGGLNAFRWLPANVDAPVADSSVVVTATENGPLVVELTIMSQAKGCRSLSRSVRLVQGQPWVEISNVVDKLPLVAKDGIHFGFGFRIPEGRTRVDIPWGIVDLEKDRWKEGNCNWLAMQRWLDVSNDKTGITWCSLDAPLFEKGEMTANISLGWGGKGPWLSSLKPGSTIYSWAMNNHWHTNFPLTQDGPVQFRYRLLPHTGYDVVQANRFGMEQAQPLVHVAAANDPQVTPLIQLDNDKVYVTILKPDSTGEATLVRLRSVSDRTESVRLHYPSGTPRRISLCELEEEAGRPAPEILTLPPYGMITVTFGLTQK